LKQTLILLLLCSGAALAQSPSRYSLSPIVGISHYALDGTGFTGPIMGVRYSFREFSSNQISIFGGATLRRLGAGYYQTEPFIYSGESQPYHLQPPMSANASPSSRLAFGLAFAGFDWRRYLADGDVRPYLGVGVQVVSWSLSGTWTGAFLPTADAGLDVRLSSGLSAFAEGQYAFGMPTMFGSKLSSLQNIFSFGVGVSFIPQW
jgi:hypothetical protein